MTLFLHIRSPPVPLPSEKKKFAKTQSSKRDTIRTTLNHLLRRQLFTLHPSKHKSYGFILEETYKSTKDRAQDSLNLFKIVKTLNNKLKSFSKGWLNIQHEMAMC